MRFYYNANMNICAEETFVTDYLFMGGMVESREEALEELRTKYEVYGWFECEVSDTIAEKFLLLKEEGIILGIFKEVS